MMSSLSSEDISVEKGLTINDSILFSSNSSLPICDNYILTRTRNIFASFSVLVQQSNPLSHWYSISNNNTGSVCRLLCVEERLLSSILKMRGLIRYQFLHGNMAMYILKDK